MARFRGTVNGGRGTASRLGHATHGLEVLAQSYSGDIRVQLYTQGDEDYVSISVQDHGGWKPCQIIYTGPISKLLTQSGRKTLVTELAKEFLTEEAA